MVAGFPKEPYKQRSGSMNPVVFLGLFHACVVLVAPLNAAKCFKRKKARTEL